MNEATRQQLIADGCELMARIKADKAALKAIGCKLANHFKGADSVKCTRCSWIGIEADYVWKAEARPILPCSKIATCPWCGSSTFYRNKKKGEPAE